MTIKLINQISETKRELFVFEVSGYSIQYEGYALSHRDDKDDIWADEYQEKFKEERDALNIKIRTAHDEDDGSYEDEELIRKLGREFDQYNPCLVKTKAGESKYYSVYGRNLPKYPWVEEAIRDLIAAKVNTLIKTLKIN
jgi:hypothetical protein